MHIYTHLYIYIYIYIMHYICVYMIYVQINFMIIDMILTFWYLNPFRFSASSYTGGNHGAKSSKTSKQYHKNCYEVSKAKDRSKK